LQFNHQRERLDAKPNLPTTLDQKLISRQTLTERAMRQYQNLQGFTDPALDWLVAVELKPELRRHLLQRLQRPDYPNLPQLVVDDLNFANSGGFGSLAIHKLLLLTQLDECLKLKPDLLNQSEFVNVYLSPAAAGRGRRLAARHRCLSRVSRPVVGFRPAVGSRP